MIKKVCVYGASSNQIEQVFFDETERLALLLVEKDIEVVFGGGALGLMGKLADTVISRGGSITGIMPHFMKEVEWAHKSVSNFHFTETMAERKEKFLVGIDGIVALAGGSGTLEELFEAITLKRLGLFTKPIVILNTAGFYNPLIAMLDNCIKNNFMSEKNKEIWSFVSSPEEVIPALENAPMWSDDAIHFATLK